MNADRKSKAIREGLQWAKEHGRRPGPKQKVTDEQIRKVIALGTAEAARRLKMSVAQYIVRRRRIEEQS